MYCPAWTKIKLEEERC